MKHPLRDEATIVGVGSTEYGRHEERSTLSLAAEALRAGIADAGIDKTDVDGIIVNVGPPLGVDYDVVCERLGLEVRYAMQTWAHGRFAGPCVQEAAMALNAGLADCIAIVCGVKFTNVTQIGGPESHEAFREGGGSHGEAPHYGLTAPGSGAAMSLSRYMGRYGARDEQLASVPIALRKHASLNEKAMMREVFGLDEYLSSRFIIEPLHIYDFSVITDGGCCLIVTRSEDGENRSSDSPPPVYISGLQGISSGREEFMFGRPGLGVHQQQESPHVPARSNTRVYDYAGVDQSEVDGFYVYDAFSPLVWFTLERFGFCGEGEAPDFCADGGIEIGGNLPVNTNGGLLSEGHLMGWGHFIEMVHQLRGDAGPRQIDDVAVLQWASTFGESVILRR